MLPTFGKKEYSQAMTGKVKGGGIESTDEIDSVGERLLSRWQEKARKELRIAKERSHEHSRKPFLP
jgi:hypothetical protein